MSVPEVVSTSEVRITSMIGSESETVASANLHLRFRLMLVSRCFRLRAGQLRTIHVSPSSTTLTIMNLRALEDLRAKFRDPSSPFYLAPGEKGPESPDPVPSSVTEQTNREAAAAEARQEFCRMGYDPATFYEQKVVWGDHDSFQCVCLLPRLRVSQRMATDL